MRSEVASSKLQVVGLFAGIGGIELGMQRAGLNTAVLCESDPWARSVLESRFPSIDLEADILKLRSLPSADVVTAGFPCQDLSQAGRVGGITGGKSSILRRMFELLSKQAKSRRPDWLVIENVPFMLHLDRGKAMSYLAEELETLGYAWAYRVVDSRAFGLPQRRRRVFLVAGRHGDPRNVLLADDEGETGSPANRRACGFYWTEGNRGLGWAVDAIPPLKGSSGLGIPSPPGIWLLDGSIVTPHIEDAERLQGFPSGWTEAASRHNRGAGARWRLVGNAVSVPVAEWIGNRLLHPGEFEPFVSYPLQNGSRWPDSAWGCDGKRFEERLTSWPMAQARDSLVDFLSADPAPLSLRAAAGFLGRLRRSSLRVNAAFLEDLDRHVANGAETTEPQDSAR